MGFHSKVAGDMLKSVYDSDEDGKIALAQLVDAVCSETEADTIADAVIAAYPSVMSDTWKKQIMVYGI